jgi:hypothetical protein
MKRRYVRYFVVTQNGERGPLTVIKVNCLFQKGELRGDQMCREETSTRQRRLDEVFPHFAPPATTVVEARRTVAMWNQEAGRASITFGVVLLAIAALQYSSFGIAPWTLSFIIVGVGAIVNGVRQRRRGDAAREKLEMDEAREARSGGGLGGLGGRGEAREK